MEHQSDRRRDVRTLVSPPAQIVRIGETERVEILNASYRGLFIRMPGSAPALNELLRFRIELPTATVEINGIPVRVVVDGNGRAGVGVRFFALNGEDKHRWEAYITSLLSPRKVAA